MLVVLVALEMDNYDGWIVVPNSPDLEYLTSEVIPYCFPGSHRCSRR
jgi:hypothetical protein